MDEQTCEKWMNKLVKNGFIYLPNFIRNQVKNKPNYEDLNIPKLLIDNTKDKITYHSRIIHVSITEQYVT